MITGSFRTKRESHRIIVERHHPLAVTQKRFLKIEELPELPDRHRGQLHKALEDVFSSDISVRNEALDGLARLDAHRRSVLTVSILVQRILDPNIEIRAKVVEMISECLIVSSSEERIPVKVTTRLKRALREIGEREILALLELFSRQELRDQICYIFNECSQSGGSLVRILSDRKQEIGIRIAASDVIAEVGFLEARPAVQSLEQRLSNLVSGQIAMSFAPQLTRDAENLLPVVRRTLRALE